MAVAKARGKLYPIQPSEASGAKTTGRTYRREPKRFLVRYNQPEERLHQAAKRQAEIRHYPNRHTSAFIPRNSRDARQALSFLVKKHHAQKYTFEVFEKDFDLWMECAQEGFVDKGDTTPIPKQRRIESNSISHIPKTSSIPEESETVKAQKCEKLSSEISVNQW